MSIRWQDARKERSFCSTCSVRERRAEAQGSFTKEQQRQSGSVRALLYTTAMEHATCTNVGMPGIMAQRSLKFEAKRTSFWSARH